MQHDIEQLLTALPYLQPTLVSCHRTPVAAATIQQRVEDPWSGQRPHSIGRQTDCPYRQSNLRQHTLTGAGPSSTAAIA